MKKYLIIGASAAALSLGMAGSAAAQFPAFGNDTQPGIIITFSDTGYSTSATGQGPYDGIEDTYIGFVNNSTKTTINSVNLSSSFCIGCFDNDGIDAYGAPGNGVDTTGYGGPASFFTNNTGTALTVNFIGGVAPGQSTYFSLEEPVSINTLHAGVPEPAAWAMMLMGFFGLGAAVRSRKQVLA